MFSIKRNSKDKYVVVDDNNNESEQLILRKISLKELDKKVDTIRKKKTNAIK
jgi:hypothetical protein